MRAFFSSDTLRIPVLKWMIVTTNQILQAFKSKKKELTQGGDKRSIFNEFITVAMT